MPTPITDVETRQDHHIVIHNSFEVIDELQSELRALRNRINGTASAPDITDDKVEEQAVNLLSVLQDTPVSISSRTNVCSELVKEITDLIF